MSSRSRKSELQRQRFNRACDRAAYALMLLFSALWMRYARHANHSTWILASAYVGYAAFAAWRYYR